MSSKTIIIALSLLSVTSTLTAAQAFDKTSLLNRTIQSCADVQCPTKSTTATVACTLTNETYTNVGVSKIPNTSGLTWVEAIVGKDLETRHFFKDFFLATDPALDNVAGAGACAIFFTKVSGKVKWTESTFPVDVAQGTCAQAMSDQCVSKLIQRAKGVGLQGLRGEEACSKLKSAFATNLDAECGDFATGTTGWTGVEARVLSGPGAPKPITREQNASSNCWPIHPKSYDLTRVMRIDTTGDGLVTTAVREFFAITPILTVVFSNTNGSSVVAQADAQLTCLKAIDLNEVSLANMSPGVPESAAPKGLSFLSPAGLLVSIFGILITLA